MTDVRKLLEQIGLSQSEIDLYLAMLSHGAMLASELMRLTRAKRPTVYYAIRQLQSRGLIRKVPFQGTQRFQAEPPEKLLVLLELRQAELITLSDEVRIHLPELKQQAPASDGVPAVSFYQGEQAMQQVIMETLYCKSRHIDSLAPRDNFFWQIGQTFSEKYVRERVSRKITTRNLWEQPLKPEIMVRSYEGVSDVRILPTVLHGKFRTTIFLYDDKVMYISSLASAYILLVQSREHHELMKAMYEGLWETSAEISVTKRTGR